MQKEIQLFKVKLISIVDGDTIKVLIDLGKVTKQNQDMGFGFIVENGIGSNPFRKTSIRFYGLNAAEKGEIEKGAKATALLTKLCLEGVNEQKELYLQVVKPDKYADRYVGIIYDKNLNCLNSHILANGEAKPYLQDNTYDYFSANHLARIKEKIKAGSFGYIA